MSKDNERKIVRLKSGNRPSKRLARVGDMLYFGATSERENVRVWQEINEGREKILDSTEIKRHLKDGLFDVRVMGLGSAFSPNDAS